MSSRGDDWWLYLAGGVVGLFGLRWLYQQIEGVDPLDQIGDALVTLTTSEEDRIAELEPGTQAALEALIANLKAQGISVHVGSTLRPPAEEKAAASSGKSAETDITLPSGRVIIPSWHEIGRAADVYPINPDTGEPDLDGTRDDLFQAMVKAARDLGFRSLAYEADGTTRHYIHTSKGAVWDGGHLEFRSPYGTLAEAIATEGAAYGLV